MRRSLAHTLKQMRRHARRGQGLVEYALILVLIAVVVIGILGTLGGKVEGIFSTINSAMPLEAGTGGGGSGSGGGGGGGGGGGTHTITSKAWHCSNGVWYGTECGNVAGAGAPTECRIIYSPMFIEVIPLGSTGTYGIASCP